MFTLWLEASATTTTSPGEQRKGAMQIAVFGILVAALVV